MNGLRAVCPLPPLIAAARVAAGVTSLTCQVPNRRSRPFADIRTGVLHRLTRWILGHGQRFEILADCVKSRAERIPVLRVTR